MGCGRFFSGLIHRTSYPSMTSTTRGHIHTFQSQPAPRHLQLAKPFPISQSTRWLPVSEPERQSKLGKVLFLCNRLCLLVVV
jgi:hypothetical protein